MKQTAAPQISKELYQEIELQINQKLFDRGYITQEWYERAKTMILKINVPIKPK
jgi:hypothetical protein